MRRLHFRPRRRAQPRRGGVGTHRRPARLASRANFHAAARRRRRQKQARNRSGPRPTREASQRSTMTAGVGGEMSADHEPPERPSQAMWVRACVAASHHAGCARRARGKTYRGPRNQAPEAPDGASAAAPQPKRATRRIPLIVHEAMRCLRGCRAGTGRDARTERQGGPRADDAPPPASAELSFAAPLPPLAVLACLPRAACAASPRSPAPPEADCDVSRRCPLR